MTDAHAPDSGHYYVPHHSPWPIFGSVTLFTVMLGAIGYLNDWLGLWSLIPGAVLLATLFFLWFSTVIDENQRGIYNLQVDRSFRMGMMWFIFSEVMFFAAFFGALFYARVLSVPWRGGHQDVHQLRAMAALRRHLAEQRPRARRRPRRLLIQRHEPLRDPGTQHADPPDQRLYRDDGPPRAALRAAHPARRVAGADFPPGLHLRRLPGLRVRRGLPGDGAASEHRHLRLDVLHAHRLPWSARHHRRDHADGDLAAGAARAFHAAAALRLRSRLLVLALRRRGVARPVHIRLLVVIGRNRLRRFRRTSASLPDRPRRDFGALCSN